MAITDLYQDKIMGGVQGDPDPFGYQNQINNFVIDNEDYQEIPGFNFIDAPTSLMSRMQNPQFLNNPRTGLIDNTLMQTGNPGNSIIDKTKNTFGKGLDIGKKGFNIGKQGLLTALGFATGLPLGILGMLPERDPRQNALDDFYGDQYGLTSTGSVASGIMKGYNPVSGGLFGTDTNYGLGGAIDKRIARIQKTLKKKKSAALEQRVKDLQELKAREAKALADAKAQQDAALESQRIGRRPTAPSGGGTRDSQSRGQASAGNTGGYSYDSGGRQGFGYGL